MNEETAFIEGRRCSPALKKHIRFLFQTCSRPDIVAAIEKEASNILEERDSAIVRLADTERALNDANELAARFKEDMETPAILRRVGWIWGVSGAIIGATVWGLLRVLL